MFFLLVCLRVEHIDQCIDTIYTKMGICYTSVMRSVLFLTLFFKVKVKKVSIIESPKCLG